MAKTPLARAGQLEPLDVVWRPYELRPEGSPPPPPDFEQYKERAFRESVQPMALQLGMTMNMPTQQPNTRLTHEAVAYAVQGEQGDQENGAASVTKPSDTFIEAVFKAYWEDDRDIGNIDVLCDLAGSVGLDAGGMRTALENRELAPYVEEKLAMAKGYGISAVPSLIINNKYLLRGLPAEDHLLDVLRQVKGE